MEKLDELLGPADFGPSGTVDIDVLVYELTDGWRLGVTFNSRPPHKLIAAGISHFTGDQEFTLFNLARDSEISIMPATAPSRRIVRDRKLSDINVTPELTAAEVISLWGPPDRSQGPKVQYLPYALADGQELWLEFTSVPPYRLHGAMLLSPAAGECKILFGKRSELEKAR